MNEHENLYLKFKEQSNNAVYQIEGCPKWLIAEEYALTTKDFELSWHTPGVMDGGIDVEVTVNHDGILSIKSAHDGFAMMTPIDRYTMQLERYRNRMITVRVDESSGKIQVATFDDPEYILWQVHYFDYIANDEVFKVVKARSKNEAKVIAWHDSCYWQRPINPENYKVWEYDGPHIIARCPKLTDDIMKTQMLLCEEYDKEYGD